MTVVTNGACFLSKVFHEAIMKADTKNEKFLAWEEVDPADKTLMATAFQMLFDLEVIRPIPYKGLRTLYREGWNSAKTKKMLNEEKEH